MSNYNINDFYPRTGQEIKDDGTVVNEANGINPDGSQNEVLLGRKPQEIQFHNALTITDTSNHDITSDVSSLSGRKAILVNNTLNQQVTISLIARPINQTFGTVLGTKNIVASSTGMVTIADIATLADPWQFLTVRAACTVAPTSGSITTFLEGVQA